MGAVCCNHEHKTWRYTRHAWQVRVLTKPRFSSNNLRRVERSRFVWGLSGDKWDDGPFTLSLLGILHGLFGIVLWIED